MSKIAQRRDDETLLLLRIAIALAAYWRHDTVDDDDIEKAARLLTDREVSRRYDLHKTPKRRERETKAVDVDTPHWMIVT
jgi:hypothetical protein